MEAQEKMTAKVFINKILQGTALGVIIGLIPNAVLSAILKYFSQYPLAVQITQIAVIFQLATPLIIGALIALQFDFSRSKFCGVRCCEIQSRIRKICWSWYWGLN